jgi:hypothetical protein
MEQKIEREWKSILCPGEKDKVFVMIEWDVLSEKGRILKKNLRQVDCHHSKLTKLGGLDCDWECEKVIRKIER